AGTIAVIVALRRWRPSWPGFLIAVALAALATALFHLPVETIASRFGQMPRALPAPSLPAISVARVIELLPSAAALALLGAIESLLSAVVADGMSGGRHRSNVELVGQGVANIGSALFGGITVTGTIARTATNVRAGAHGPVAGIAHSAFLLAFLMIAAPLAGFIPLAALAGLLSVVAWNMAERREFWLLVRSGRGEAVVLLATFLLTVFVGLAEGIVVGFGLKALIFIHRMSDAAEVEQLPAEEAAPEAEEGNGDILVYRLKGVFFFGVAATAGRALDAISGGCRALIVDFSQVRVIDSTGARMLATFLRRMRRPGLQIYVAAMSPELQAQMGRHGTPSTSLRFADSVAGAMQQARTDLARDSAA
ncbi:MAG: SulP family inorganic anion transporter, partial [Paracoccaceae bacterium]